MQTVRPGPWCWTLMMCAGLALPARALPVSIAVVFDDPGQSYGIYHAGLERLAVAAGRDWLARFDAPVPGVALTVKIGFAPVPTANGRSAAAAPAGLDAQGRQLLQQGATHKLKTGQDVNGDAADVEFNFGTLGYLQNELWFDPDPWRMAGPVPFNHTDAYSVMLHEWGHAFGFNGWLNGFTGVRPPGYQSTFDQWVDVDTVNGLDTLLFKGPQAMAVYGGPVPLTQGNYMHLGNFGPRAGSDLVPDLMNGVVYYRGNRYGISALDLAVLADSGVPMRSAQEVPEPASWALVLAALFAALAARAALGARGGRGFSPAAAWRRSRPAPRRGPTAA